MQTTLKIVSRASNRVFVGLPICEYESSFLTVTD